MFRGVGYFLSGVKLVLKPGIKRYVLIPLLINIIIFSIGLWAGLHWFDRFLERILPSWLDWAEFILWPLFTISYFLIVFYTFALLVNLIAAPFNGLLAEKIEILLRGGELKENPTTMQQVLKDIPRTIGSELGKLVYFLLRSIPLLILFLIPGINLLAPFIWFAFSAWMLSLEYLDYPLGNHNILFKQTRNLVKKKRIRCLSFGAITSGLTLVPVINFIVMPVAVAGATKMVINEFSEQINSQSTR